MTDKEQYRKEHMLIFGHAPVTDISGRRFCAHPMHDALRGMMDMPGVDVEIPFNTHEVRTEDDPEVTAFNQAYEKAVDDARDLIAEVQEREEYDKRKKNGI